MADDKHPLVSRARRFAIIGTAFLVLLGVLAGATQTVKWVWAAAQRVEVYVGLPEWLGRVESKVDDNGRKLDLLIKAKESE